MSKFKDIDKEFKLNKGVLGLIKIRVKPSVYEQRIPKAQFYLDNAIAMSMLPYIPMESGNLKQQIVTENAAVAGSGKVCVYTTPYGRYQYYGKKMVDSETGKGPMRIPLADGRVIYRYRKGAKLVPTNTPLNYTSETATPFWYDTAKNLYKKEWIKGVERILTHG